MLNHQFLFRQIHYSCGQHEFDTVVDGTLCLTSPTCPEIRDSLPTLIVDLHCDSRKLEQDLNRVQEEALHSPLFLERPPQMVLDIELALGSAKLSVRKLHQTRGQNITVTLRTFFDEVQEAIRTRLPALETYAVPSEGH